MTTEVNLFFRHPDPIYFSLEKLFTAIGRQILSAHPREFEVNERQMPFPTSLQKLLANIRYASKHQAAINHITGDVHYAILGCSKRKINILTIHDCVMLHRYPPGHPRRLLMKWLWYDWPVKKADIVTVISNSTKEEVLRFTGCDPEKIRVIPDFVDPAFQPAAKRSLTGPPRILFIGSTPNKNLERLIQAMTGMDVQLDIIGRLTPEQEKMLHQQQVSYALSSGLSQDALLEKYRQCDMLAFPSTYEGFGLPIIEAQAIGRPVLTSDRAPVKEVAGGAACLVDPFSVEDIRRGLSQMLDNEGYRDRLVADGFRNVRRFSLEEVTRQYVELYREQLQKKNKSLLPCAASPVS